MTVYERFLLYTEHMSASIESCTFLFTSYFNALEEMDLGRGMVSIVLFAGTQ